MRGDGQEPSGAGAAEEPSWRADYLPDLRVEVVPHTRPDGGSPWLAAAASHAADAADAADAAQGSMGDIAPALREAGAAHLRACLAAHPATFDGPVLALETLDREAAVLRVRPGGYFGMLASCDLLRAERGAGGRGGGAPLLRAAVAAAGGDPVVSGAGRVAALGLSVVVVAAGRHTRVLLGRRRPGVAIDAGAWHVAPSGMLEDLPAGGEPVVTTAAAEFAEELGMRLTRAELRVRLVVLGVTTDLRRLRPDVSVALRLHPDESAALERDLRARAMTSPEFDRLALVPADDGPGRGRALTAAAAGTLALLAQALADPALAGGPLHGGRPSL